MKFLPYVTSCRIELFGGLKVKFGSEVVTQFRTRKTATLLAYLALHPGEHTREALIELLWPEYELEAGRNSLNVSLNSLRALFNSLYEAGALPAKQQDEAEMPVTQPFLQADRFTVGLNRNYVIVDVHQFEHRLRAADLSENSPGAIAILRHVLGMYNRLLPEFYEDWIFSEAQRLNEVYFASLQKLIDYLSASNERQLAIAYARRGLVIDETREDIHRALMQLLLESGQSGAAYRHYKGLEELLQRRYSIRPDTKTRQLSRHIQKAMQQGELTNDETSDESVPLLPTAFDELLESSEVAFLLTEENPPPDVSSPQQEEQKSVGPPDGIIFSAPEAINTEVQAIVIAYFENYSRRRAMNNLPYFQSPDTPIIGITRGGGTGVLWQSKADVHLDILQRELVNLSVDMPYLVKALHIQAFGGLIVAYASIVNTWVCCEYVMVFTTEENPPKITSVTLESHLPKAFQ